MGAVLEWHCLMLCSVLSSGATGEELMLFGPGSLREVMTQGATDYQTAYSVMVTDRVRQFRVGLSTCNWTIHSLTDRPALSIDHLSQYTLAMSPP